MGFPTKEQSKAIQASSGTLVSAAAGSGKTAVLVERVIRLLTVEKISADRLLIVTFTDLAAKEMRLRIEKRMNEECRTCSNEDKGFFIKQKLQLRNAKICTIDSFCIELVRENFDRLEINPDFSIADNGTIVMLGEMALNEVLNSHFDSGDKGFLSIANQLSNDTNENNLKKYINEIFDYSQNMPFPESWLAEQIKKYENSDTVDESFDMIYRVIDKKIKIAVDKFNIAVKILAQFPELEEAYRNNYMSGLDDLKIILKTAQERNWDKLRHLISGFSFDELPRINGVNDIPQMISFKELREESKEAIVGLKSCLYDDYEMVIQDLKESAMLTCELCKVALEYMRVFEKKRREKNMMTFSDTEHLALSLLCEYSEGGYHIKESAKSIISRFDEVLVDEFQDTNNMQDLLFSVLADNEKKLFVVGDLKQSIYRFRGANPKNFSDKKDRYTPFEEAKDDELKKITLGKNFRSRKGICDFVNFFFDIMLNGSKSYIKYNLDDHLIYGADFEEKTENDVEISFVESGKADDIEVDAKNIADFIHRYMREGMITDKSTKKPRKPQFGDFTILMRGISKDGTKYAKELNKYGIPVSYSLNDYIKCGEVQMILSLLNAIENPSRDIEIVACLLSPLFMFTADEVVDIKLLAKKGHIISAIAAKAGQGDEKCKSFLKRFSTYSNVAVNSSLSDLISYIYEDTKILNIVSLLGSGQSRKSNLNMLLSLAIGFENNGVSNNISHFIEYVKKLSEKTIKPAGENAGDESVTLMTIHKSKGLQFPVCILAGTTSIFSNADITGRLLINEDEISLKFKRKDGTDISSIRRFAIADSIRDEQYAEELRLLYVAMTRAEEKLFISASFSNLKNKFSKLCGYLCASSNVDEFIENIYYKSSYASLIIIALMLHKSAAPIRNNCEVSGAIKDSACDIDVILKNIADIKLDESDNSVIKIDDIDYDTANIITNAIADVYDYQSLREIESKASVTEVAHKAETKDYSFTSLPAFMMKSGMTPAQRGTATHRFMQFADFDNAETDINAEIDRLYEMEFITYKEKQAIDTRIVSKFFESELYRRIRNSARVEREMRFLTEIPAGELKDDIDESVKDEKVVVQGSVDCAFIEDDKVVVVDFKTDRIKSDDELKDAYGRQLGIYAEACRKIFGMDIKQKLIYSFALSREIEL